MLLPIGFGNWPRKFPLIILMLFLGISAISFRFFDEITKIEKEHQVEIKTIKPRFLELTNSIREAACLKKFNQNPSCLTSKSLPGNTVASGPKMEKSWDQIQFEHAFNDSLDKWPQEAKMTEEWQEFKAIVEVNKQKYRNKYTSLNIVNSENINFFSLLLSTITHADLYHLFGNMFMMILLGIWVEQKTGSLRTLILFLVGSFIGIFLQVMFVPDIPVLGASAGVSALMGAFFAFFHRNQFTFLFTFTLLDYRRINLPIIWTFPFMYFATDFIMLANDKSGVAHIAHVGGLVTGFLFGLYFLKNEDLRSGELFKEEKVFNDNIRTTTDTKDLWKNFEKVMQWNCQNVHSLEMFLVRAKELEFRTMNMKDRVFLENCYKRLTRSIFINGTNREVLKWIKLIPSFASMERYLVEMPITHCLSLADQSAKKKDWITATLIYEISLTKEPSRHTKQAITIALEEINNILKGDSA